MSWWTRISTNKFLIIGEYDVQTSKVKTDSEYSYINPEFFDSALTIPELGSGIKGYYLNGNILLPADQPKRVLVQKDVYGNGKDYQVILGIANPESKTITSTFIGTDYRNSHHDFALFAYSEDEFNAKVSLFYIERGNDKNNPDNWKLSGSTSFSSTRFYPLSDRINDIDTNSTDIYSVLQRSITLLDNRARDKTFPYHFFESNPGPYSPDPAGPSTSGGGDGSFDNKSDPVDFTELPSLSVINSGFAGLFKPTLSQLNALANYLWNEDINFDQLKKLVANPIDLLISLTIMPVDPPTAGSESIKVGFIDTGISINKLENQYMAIDFGSLEVKEYYGNALDYSPYTKISIYLPYIGLKQLNTDDVMKKTLALRYNVDLFTGACVAEIKAGESVLYTFTGNIANQIPLNAESFNSFLSGLIQAAASVGVAIASHGTSVATQGAAEAGEATAMAARGAQTASNLASMNAALTSAGAVATSKPDILHSGSMTANNGYLSGKTPYLIYEVPRACIPENYQTFVGYPSNITKALSEVTGFTVVDSVHLENIPATDRELAEIERLLRGGVIL